MNKVGLLLVNLGTPQSSDIRHVRAYLREFLSDPMVIDLPAWLRWLLVHGVILPKRAKKSAAAYASIWQSNGSPLLVNSQKFVRALSPHYSVALGMRYGTPSIATAIQQLGNVQKIIVLPLFPQYSVAATESALAATRTALAQQQQQPAAEIIFVRDFFQDPAYISAMVGLIAPYLQHDFEYLLTSYHGLPVRQAGDYRQQCLTTSRLIAQQLQIPEHNWGISFQSRLGFLPWIKPYTNEVLPQLYQRGIRKLLVCCPSFVADCLETLEEIGIRARQQWLELGGEELTLIPALNGQADWIRSIVG